MPVKRLYRTWFARIEQMWPHPRITQRRNLAWLLAGICQSCSVHLHHIAEQIPGRAKLVSLTRRLSRFTNNSAIRVRSLYAPIAQGLLQAASRSREIRLVVDAAKVSFGHQLLIVAIAYRKLALSLAWNGSAVASDTVRR